jgi:hypothetical protein
VQHSTIVPRSLDIRVNDGAGHITALTIASNEVLMTKQKLYLAQCNHAAKNMISDYAWR